MSYISNRQSNGIKLETSLSLSVYSPLLPLANEKTAIVSYLTPLAFLSWRTPWTCSVLYFLPRAFAGQSFRLSCHALTVFWLLSFRLWPRFSRSSCSSCSSHCCQEVNRHILLLPARLSVSVSSPASILFCFLFSALSRCLCLLFCGQKCGTLCGAQLFDFDCFVLIEMFLQLLPASLPPLLRALPQAGTGAEWSTTAKRIRTSS